MRFGKELRVAIRCAKIAGKYVEKRYRDSQYGESFKKDHEIVTDADKISEKTIIDIIEKKFPNHSIWAEEGGTVKKKSMYRWVIDPIDGTLVFSRKFPTFGISIGIEKNNVPVAGVVYFPVLKQIYYAEKGKGSYCNGKKINVSKRNNDDDRIYLTTTYLMRNPSKIKKYLPDLKSRKLHFFSFGSAALHMCYVASGKADGSLVFGIKPGDISASMIIVQEAGGKVINPKGNKAKTSDPNVIATNGLVRL